MHLRVTTYLVHSSITYDPIVCKYLGYSSLTKRSGDMEVVPLPLINLVFFLSRDKKLISDCCWWWKGSEIGGRIPSLLSAL